MNSFPESELVLNADGSVYHLHLRPEDVADTIIAVGDPERVEKVSKYFDRIELVRQKREFVTHTGYIGNKRLSVISSGIGTDNVEIVMNELDALVNIDLESRTEKPTKTRLKIIRLGTSGCLQADVPVDSILVSDYGIGLDGLNDFYVNNETKEEEAFCLQLQSSLSLRMMPYAASASALLLQHFEKELNAGWYQGITLTCPGFYAPQGRKLRFNTRVADFVSRLQSFGFDGKRLTNFEMETAGYYLFGKILGHDMLSISAILANRVTQQFSKAPEKGVEKMIETVLERIAEL